jgi:peptidoglycan/xylan/chitin deacetylase (PgdA/CDA1 family)
VSFSSALSAAAALVLFFAIGGCAVSNPAPREVDQAVRVPVLMYHHIAPVPENADPVWKRYCVRPSQFVDQLRWLKDHGYQTITPDELAAHFDQGTPLPDRPIMLTFDDGWAEQFSAAFPSLVLAGYRGVFYVTTWSINASGYISWDQLATMRDAGMAIEPHTISHSKLPGVTDDSKLETELVEPRRLLREKLGVAAQSFAYPYGEFDNRVIAAVGRAGYTTAFTTESGIEQRESGRLVLPRQIVTSDDTIDDFARIVRGGPTRPPISP